MWVRERSDDGDGDDRADAKDLLKSTQMFVVGTTKSFELRLKLARLTHSGSPGHPVAVDELGEFGVGRLEIGDELLPSFRGLEGRRAASNTCSPQERFDGDDLGGRRANEAPSPHQGLSDETNFAWWNVDDRSIHPHPKAMAKLLGIAGVTLLAAASCGSADLIGVDHLRVEAEHRELTRDEERNGAGLQGHGGLGRNFVTLHEFGEGGRCRRELARRER